MVCALAALASLSALAPPALGAPPKRVTVLAESFEVPAGARYATSVPEYTDGDMDYFLSTDGSDTSFDVEITGQHGKRWFAAQDLDGEGGLPEQSLTLAPASIAGLRDLRFSGLFAEDDATDGEDDWDTGPLDLFDWVRVTYRVDGGEPQPLLGFAGTGEEPVDSNLAPGLDAAPFDGHGDGATLTDRFRAFTAPIPATGRSLELTIAFRLDAGDEDVAVDRLVVTGLR